MNTHTDTVIWVDAGHGASGDMLLAALWDVGVPGAVMADAARAVVPVSITFSREDRHGMTVARAHVHSEEISPPHRTWATIRQRIEDADLAAGVKDRALRTFGRLAEAEAIVHGVDVTDVHFHEVGAHDSIADIVGVCAGFAWLGSTVRVGPIALGGGTVSTDHGVLPVPAPAVVQVLAGSKAVSHGGPIDVELCTPTGATLLTTLAEDYGAMPPMSITGVGLGCGSRVLADRVGALRVIHGVPAPQPVPAAPNLGTDVEMGEQTPGWDTVASCVLTTNVDDMDPRLWPDVLHALLQAGAADAWLTPILMKKGRPAHTLHVLTDDDPALFTALSRIIWTHTSALGLRRATVHKAILDRDVQTIDVHGQQVRVKIAYVAGRVVNAQPEYDDVLAAAIALDMPPKTVLAQAVSQVQADISDGD
ncbi:MAG: nickel pincer cofactor biosynthesis protein LarC [Actinomycetota bacterium]